MARSRPQRPIEELLAGLTRPTLAWQLITGRSKAQRRKARRPLRPWVAGRTQTVPGEPRLAGEYGGLRRGSDLAVPARLVGWLEPGNQAKGGDTS